MENHTIKTSNSEFHILRNSLQRLIVEYGLVAIKSGTEVEDMTFAELGFLREVTRDMLPLLVKIGGPEARNDMRACLDLNVDGIIAPMIESSFALFKFISSLKTVAGPEDFQSIRKGVNLESKCAVENLDEIFSSPYVLDLDQITAARSDLSASLDTDVEDPVVTSYCRTIVDYSHKIQIETSVGGKIVPETIEKLIEAVPVGMVNTRHMVLSVPLIRSNSYECVSEALKFEIILYKILARNSIKRRKLHQDRVVSLENRIVNASLLTT